MPRFKLTCAICGAYKISRQEIHCDGEKTKIFNASIKRQRKALAHLNDLR